MLLFLLGREKEWAYFVFFETCWIVSGITILILLHLKNNNNNTYYLLSLPPDCSASSPLPKPGERLAETSVGPIIFSFMSE